MDEDNPMSGPDQWEADLERRYPLAEHDQQSASEFRNYQAETRPYRQSLLSS